MQDLVEVPDSNKWMYPEMYPLNSYLIGEKILNFVDGTDVTCDIVRAIYAEGGEPIALISASDSVYPWDSLIRIRRKANGRGTRGG